MTIIEISDERSRALLKNREGTSDQRKAVELDEVLLGILHRLDDGTSERKVAYDHLLAIENEMKRRGSRGDFARYLVAICSHSGLAILRRDTQANNRGKRSGTWLATRDQTDASGNGCADRARGGRPENAWRYLHDPQQHQIVVGLTALGQTVDQLAASQDQMVHQIDMLQNSNQEILASNREILEKIPAPPPPPPTVAPTHKPTASIRRPYP